MTAAMLGQLVIHAGIAFGTEIIFGITLGGLLVSAALSAGLAAVTYGIQAALYKKPETFTPSSRIDNLRHIGKNNIAPWRVVYGQARISGILFYARSVNKDGEDGGFYLHFGLAICRGPVEDIYAIQLNDEPCPGYPPESGHWLVTTPGSSRPISTWITTPTRVSATTRMLRLWARPGSRRISRHGRPFRRRPRRRGAHHGG